jgi:type II secretory pathway pseudopilin PulG
MDLAIKSSNRRSAGFSILEMLLVVAIVMTLVGVSASFYSSFKVQESLNTSVFTVVEAIRHAQSNAESGRGNAQWGVKLLTTSGVLFKGASYASRDVNFDQSFDYAKGVNPSGLSEVVFAEMTGTTSNTGIISLTNNYGTKDITINAQGTLTY